MERRKFLRHSAALLAAGAAHYGRAADQKKPARGDHYQRVYDEQYAKNRATLDAMAARGGDHSNYYNFQYILAHRHSTVDSCLANCS